MDALPKLILKVYKMYSIRIKFLLAVAMFAFSACTESTPNEIDIPDEPTTSQMMTLTGEIEQMDTRVNVSGFTDADQIGVFVTKNNTLSSASNNKLDNALFTYDKSSNEFKALSGNEIRWASDETTLSVFAYYPYAKEVGSVTAHSFEVNSNQTSSDSFYKSDFLAAQVVGVDQKSQKVALQFKHLLSRINVTVKRDSDSDDEQWPDDKSFSISGVVTKAAVNLNTRTVATGTDTGSITFMPAGADTNGNPIFSAIVVPQSDKTGVVFQFTIDGVNYSYKPDKFTCLSNVQYNYSFVIDATDTPTLKLVGATINGWGESKNMEEESMDKDSSSSN